MLNLISLRPRVAILVAKYHSLSPIQKKWARAATLLFTALTVYGLLQATWNFRQESKAIFAKEQALLQLMQQQAEGIRQLNAARQAKTGNDTSLLALLSKTAGDHKLALQRYEPGTDGKLAVWLSNADFNTLLAWMDQLARQYNVRIDHVSISSASTAGLVEAQLQLRE